MSPFRPLVSWLLWPTAAGSLRQRLSRLRTELGAIGPHYELGERRHNHCPTEGPHRRLGGFSSAVVCPRSAR